MEYRAFAVGEIVQGLSEMENYQHLLDLVRIAEEVDMDGFFFAEHHGDRDFCLTPSPNLLMAMASQITDRLRLGAMVTVLPYHHPLRAAEEIRMLDVLTNGRLDIGLGRGAIRHEQAAYGVVRDHTAEIFEEGADVLFRLLRDGHATFKGRWWQGEVHELVPGRIQNPHPPVWLATISDNSIIRAAKMGAHGAVSLMPLEQALRQRDRYRELWEEHQGNSDWGKFSFGVHLACAETREEADRFARGPIAAKAERFLKQISDKPAQHDPAYSQHEAGWRSFADADFDGLIEASINIYGTVDDCVEQLQKIVDAGIEAVTVMPRYGGLDPEFAKRSLELFGTEVVRKADPGHALSVLQ